MLSSKWRLALVATLALLVSGATSAQGSTTPKAKMVCPMHYTVPQFMRFARAVLPDASPKDVRELNRVIPCQAYKPHRPYLHQWWRNYENPPGWVIPSYIVWCESKYQNLPPNGASASGYYQIIDSTWAAKGGGRYASRAWLASKRGQDIIARRIWTEDGSGQWDCA